MNHWQVNSGTRGLRLRPARTSLWPVKFISFNIIWQRDNLSIYIHLVGPKGTGIYQRFWPLLDLPLFTAFLGLFSLLCSCFKCWLLTWIYVYCRAALARNYHKLHCHYSKKEKKVKQNATINMKIQLFSVIAAQFRRAQFIFGSWQFIVGSLWFIFSLHSVKFCFHLPAAAGDKKIKSKARKRVWNAEQKWSAPHWVSAIPLSPQLLFYLVITFL